ncbi:MAG: ADP-ribosylation factor-like protein [Promethearchaeota archaeon]
MSLDYLKDALEGQSKILFTGLDTAGKTSIILALQREFSKIAILAPTRGAQRRMFHFMGRDISEWDLGGQISYRISYLKNPSKYFDGTEVAIYVIDIQNKPRIPEALSYLNDVIEQFKKLEIEPPIYIFFHKYDPALIKAAKNEMNNLLLNLKDKIKQMTDYPKIYFYHTTIYDLSTIIHSISEILLSLYPKAELIEKTIQEFSDKVESDGAVLIDDNSLVIGSYYRTPEAKHLLNASTPYFLTLNDSFQLEEVMGVKEDQMVVQRFGKYFIFRQISLRENVPYYLLIMKEKSPDFSKEDYDTFINLMREIIYK